MQERPFGDLTTCFALLALLVTLQFAASFGGWGLALSIGLLLGLASVPVGTRVHVSSARWWPLPLAVLLASLAGVLVSLLLPETPVLVLGAPLAAALGSLLARLLQQRGNRRCGLCHHRIGTGEVVFGCPRCQLSVCDRTCWDFEHRRCRLCSENHVPLLPQGEQWWDRTFGPRASFGRCRICFASFEERDLRNCGRCGRPQCRNDWDDANGECLRCGWVCPDLPDSLRSIAVSVTGVDGKFSTP